MSNYEVAERTEDGLEILRKKPLLEQHFTVGDYVIATIFILILTAVVYGIVLILFGSYKVFSVKDKAVKLKGKKQIKRGIIIFAFSFALWVLINLANAFFGVNTLC